MKEVTKGDFRQFIKKYPRPIDSYQRGNWIYYHDLSLGTPTFSRVAKKQAITIYPSVIVKYYIKG